MGAISRRGELLAAEETWCGRYALLAGGRVYLDAAGLLGVFFGSGGVSSSCRILAASMGLPEKRFASSSSLNWLPGPLTQYEEIRRLLPSQIYDYRSGSIAPGG